MSTRLIAYFFLAIAFSKSAIAADQIYVREYTYQASEADSKLSARAIALQEVKRQLLSELGTHVSSIVKIQSSANGITLGTEEIETLSAGITRVEILNEKWNGTEYVLKAQIKADPAEVLKSIEKLLDVNGKQKQISQLNDENLRIAESLTKSRQETTDALAELARLKKQLSEQQTDISKQALQSAYQQQVDQLTLNDWVESGYSYFLAKNYLAALPLLRRAAEQGNARSQFAVGLMYMKGQGVDRDYNFAAYWFKKSAEQGNAGAQNTLGALYIAGWGVDRDLSQSFLWFKRSAEQGDQGAEFNLGQMYANGRGVNRDLNQAAYWYKKSAAQGNEEARNALQSLVSEKIE